MLGLDRSRLQGLPSGVELERFRPRPLTGAARQAFWRRWLVDDPQGWAEQARPGSISYHDDELASFGRFADAAADAFFVRHEDALHHHP